MKHVVSIIIPVYNSASYLDACLQSVYEQTYQQIEIILVDDGSHAACKEKLQDHARNHPQIKLFTLEENKGVGHARNYGIQQATGEYLYFLDSDDYLAKETIALLLENIGSHDIIKGSLKQTYLGEAMVVTFPGPVQPTTYIDNRYALLKDYSALNYLIKRDFVIQHHLAFSEESQLFADMYFMLAALAKNEYVPYIKQAVYFKRLRNDPILQPALSQTKPAAKIIEFLHMYEACKAIFQQDELIQHFLDELLLNFYRKEIVLYFAQTEHVEKVFHALAQAVQKIDSEFLATYDWKLRQEIKPLIAKRLAAYQRINRRYQFLRALRAGMKSQQKFYQFLYKYVFSKLPMKKKLVFLESFLGKSYSDSPKYIYEYLMGIDEKYQFVWSVNEPLSIPGNAKQARRFGLRYYYYAARAKYWISNSRLPIYLEKRQGNIYLQTWHGTPLKKLVFDMEDIYSADPKYKENFYHQSRRWDFLSSPNRYSSDIFKRAFQYDKQMLEFGYPRNDILYQKNNDTTIHKLKEKMQLPTDKKIILYAPTWRDDDFISRGKYNFALQLDLKRMQQQLGTEYVIVLRLHYFIAHQFDISEYKGFAYNFSQYDDIAELYLVSDVLITDYSSVFFDYAHLQRPILFYTYDLEKYRDQLRGFYLDMEKELPGPLLETTDEVIESILHLEEIQQQYAVTYAQFYDTFCKWDDGKAAAKTVHAVFNNKINGDQQ